MAPATRTDARSAAQICRANGWKAGTRLVGDEGYGPTVIELTAIGESHVLAKAVTRNGEPVNGDENLWTLSSRDWAPVAAAAPTPPRTSAPPGEWMRRLLRRDGTSPRWVWALFRLWECACHARFRTRRALTDHRLGCRTDRASHGQG